MTLITLIAIDRSRLHLIALDCTRLHSIALDCTRSPSQCPSWFHSWTKLCSAPRGIADAHWRNCPQFQTVNVGKEPVPMNVFLSYGDRDMLRNQRHTTTTDAPNGLGADDSPTLSLWVMKSTVPDRRYVGYLGGALPLVHASAHHDAPSTSPQVRGRALPLRGGVCRPLDLFECVVRLGSMDPRACKCSPRRPLHFPTGASRLGGPSLPAVCTRSSQSWPKAPTTRCARTTPQMTTH